MSYALVSRNLGANVEKSSGGAGVPTRHGEYQTLRHQLSGGGRDEKRILNPVDALGFNCMVT